MAYCWNCSFETDYSNKFCPKCGAELSKTPGSFSKFSIVLILIFIASTYFFWDSRNNLANQCNKAILELNNSAMESTEKYNLCNSGYLECISAYNESKKSNYQIYTQYTTCNSDLESKNATLKNCQTALSDCQAELSKFQSSPEFFFYTKINYADEKIRAQAIAAKESFSKASINPNITDSEIISYRDCVFNDNITAIEQYNIMAAMGLYTWVRDNIEYVLGPPSQTTQMDTVTLRLRAGKCDEQSLLLLSMAKSIGLDAKLVVVKTDMSQQECNAIGCSIYDANHAIAYLHVPGINKCNPTYSQYKIAGDTDWVLLDTTCKQCKFGQLPPADIGKAYWVLDVV